MSNENTMTSAAFATHEARTKLLDLIADDIERIRATPESEMDHFQEAMELLEKVEMWTKEYHSDGYLILRDPADEITMESI
ncbi:hypothetical protein FE844_004545 [Rhizobium indicum]|uniref:hypothetical protein n=1 Tax=Rhizobium indicum TaxID=2583231 RepID=UPI001106828D|nr:hypothetical protein [Rhizobium indicum]QKK28888.1 hypothetical protein FE844_004545 [Rhizobium indicum]